MSHTPAASTPFDARDHAGAVVMSTATTGNVTIDSAAAVFLCAVGFANGYGSATAYTLSTLINAAWPAAGALTVGTDRAGFFYIESDTVDFAIDADAVNVVFGFDAAGHALVGGVAPFRRTAPNRFQRGIIDLDNGLMITPSGGSSTEMPTTLPRVQSLVTWIRERGAEGDADDLYDGTCLEDALPAGSTCVVEGNGALSIETPSGEAITWPSTAAARSFARAIGHRGATSHSPADGLPLDTETTDSGGRILRTGAYNVPGFVDATDGELVPYVEVDEDRATAGNGYVSIMERHSIGGFVFRFGVAGAATGRATDRANALRVFLTRADSTVTVYPSWGSGARTTGAMEIRRHRGMARCVADVVPHDLLYTADADESAEFYGPRSGGRLILRSGGDRSRDDAYTGRTNALQQVELRLYVDPAEHPEADDA